MEPTTANVRNSMQKTLDNLVVARKELRGIHGCRVFSSARHRKGALPG
jgi:hypothetical protein